MLSCREVNVHHASDYLDHRLPARKRLAVGLHLLICSGCRRFMRQFSLVKAVLRRNADVALPDAEAKALANRLQAAREQQMRQQK